MKNELSYLQRAEYCTNPTAKKLFALMAQKKTNLSVSLDVTNKQQLLMLADVLGPEICVLKTHIDILQDFDPAVTTALTHLAQKHEFLIFEDRKFADIGHTVQSQYARGIYHMADWSDMVNAHILPGPGIIEGLKTIGLPKKRGLLLLAQMSAKDNLLNDAYTQTSIAMAEQHPDFVMGFIAMGRLTDDPKWIYLTPGVNISNSGDQLGQQYVSPEQAILERGTDIIIVGRGIYQATDPALAAQTYRKAGWEAYQKRLTASPQNPLIKILPN